MKAIVSILLVGATLTSTAVFSAMCGGTGEVGSYVAELRVEVERLATKRDDKEMRSFLSEVRRVSEAIPALVDVHNRIAAVARVSPTLYICLDDEINALARGRDRSILVTTGLLNMTGSDKDMLAAAIGHEFAHLVRDHAGAREYAGTVFDAQARTLARDVYRRTGRFDTANAVGGRHREAKAKAFSREQEVDADDYGTKLLSEAKFRPDGPITFHLRMISIEGNQATAWNSSHPGYAERLYRVEPRVIDESFNQTAKALTEAKDWKALGKLINTWLKDMPDSGQGWFHKGTYLERAKRIEYVAAYERALTRTKPPLIQTDELERAKMWLSLCVGLFREGYKRESAVCSRNIADRELREEFDRQTFRGKMVSAGEIPKYDALSVARDNDGRVYITNDTSFLKARGVATEPIPPAWSAMRVSPQLVDKSLSTR